MRFATAVVVAILGSVTNFGFSATISTVKPKAFCLRHGEQRACFDLALDVQAVPTAPVLAPVSFTEFTWTMREGVYIGTQSTSMWNATVTLKPTDDTVTLSLSIHYTKEAVIEREAMTVRFPGTARALARDLTFSAVRSTLRVDRGTPIFVTAGELVLVGETGLVAARYQGSASRSNGRETEVQLLLDDRAAHPFSMYAHCLDKLSTRGSNWLGLERTRIPKDRITRAAGTIVQAQARLYLVDPSVPTLPLIIERWEAGAKAAFVITDHADRTDPQALRAVLYGTANIAAPEYGKRGLFGHGLKITKTFFAHGKLGTLDDDAESRALAAEIVAAGSEVGSHSITAKKDSRDSVEKGLASFAPWQTVTWIDHQPYTNCEALSNLGWDKTGEYGIGDLLLAHGYRWIWTASDFNRWGLQLGNLFGGDPGMAMPVFFPFPPEPRLWVFRSQWFYAPPAQLARAISDTALSRLEEQRGIFVAHTYLSASAATTHEPGHRQALAVRPSSVGTLTIDATLDKAFARVGTRIQAGTLASMTWRDAGDRLRRLGDITTRYRADGSVEVENHALTEVSGLTVAIPHGNAEFTLVGGLAIGRRREAHRSTMWFSLPKSAHVKLTITVEGRKIPFLPMQPATLEAL